MPASSSPVTHASLQKPRTTAQTKNKCTVFILTHHHTHTTPHTFPHKSTFRTNHTIAHRETSIIKRMQLTAEEVTYMKSSPVPYPFIDTVDVDITNLAAIVSVDVQSENVVVTGQCCDGQCCMLIEAPGAFIACVLLLLWLLLLGFAVVVCWRRFYCCCYCYCCCYRYCYCCCCRDLDSGFLLFNYFFLCRFGLKSPIPSHSHCGRWPKFFWCTARTAHIPSFLSQHRPSQTSDSGRQYQSERKGSWHYGYHANCNNGNNSNNSVSITSRCCY